MSKMRYNFYKNPTFYYIYILLLKLPIKKNFSIYLAFVTSKYVLTFAYDIV